MTDLGRKVRRDLLSAFGGVGSRGFLWWLRLGGFLTPIENEVDRVQYNDRLAVIGELIGEDHIDALQEQVADAVLRLARLQDEQEGDDDNDSE